MKYLISTMKSNLDNNSLEIISCFQRAFGLCLNNYNGEYAKLFFMIDNYYNCYCHTNFDEDNYLENQKKILSHFFNIKLCIYKVRNENLHSVIEYNIKKNFPVIVPGNLYELFYSRHYKETDWIHPFTIRGFDNNKHIYFILDNIQLNDEDSKEREFFIKYKELGTLFDSYNKKFNTDINNRIYVFSAANASYINLNNIFDDFFKLYKKNLHKERFKEFKLIRKIQKEIINAKLPNVANYPGKIEYLMTMPKMKDFFFTELFNYLFLYQYIDKETYDILNIKKDDIVILWKKYINSFLRNIYKNQLDCNDFDTSHILQKEEEIYFYITNNAKIFINETKKLIVEKYEVENNNGIIQSCDNNFQFCFSDNIIYNTWIHDNSPKVFLKTISSITQFDILVEVYNNPLFADFVAGIVFKDSNDCVYFYGIDSERRINLDAANSVASIKEIISSIKSIVLRLEVKENKTLLYYRNVQSESSFIHFYTFSGDFHISKIGFGCKTYNAFKHLTVKFKVLES